MKVLWNRCAIIKLLIDFQINAPIISMNHRAQYCLQKNVIFPKGATVDTTNILQVELLHMYFDLYNFTYVWVFTSMLTVVGSKKRVIWIFSIASK